MGIASRVVCVEGLPPGLETSGAVEIASALGAISGGHVLDVGTGEGDFIIMLMRTLRDFQRFTGVDVDAEDLASARGEFEGESVDIVTMDGGDLAFRDGTFDTVCISNSMHHMERVERVLDEMFRVLRPEGVLIVHEMFTDGEQSEAQRTHDDIHKWSARVDMIFGEYHRRTYTKEEILDRVTSLELASLEVYETSRLVKCLSCDDRWQCEDPLDEDVVASILQEIDDDIERLADCPDRDLAASLIGEGDALKVRLEETGDLPASALFIIGRK
jgi:ubiquinone/menaquinone biosynthesis C-methylase UbiE